MSNKIARIIKLLVTFSIAFVDPNLLIKKDTKRDEITEEEQKEFDKFLVYTTPVLFVGLLFVSVIGYYNQNNVITKAEATSAIMLITGMIIMSSYFIGRKYTRFFDLRNRQ